MASVVLPPTHFFGHPLASAVLTPPLALLLLTPIKCLNSSHFTILDFPLWLPRSQDNPHPLSHSLFLTLTFLGLDYLAIPLSHPVFPN